ncbi:hypothetical protein [Rubellimicrobium sp. CFH 75288]|uniref:hypothetical protein n=1 Tax=Rubellimicrobium sp. CFH 75288 TaxID=2697034 RepID=UPI001412BEFE|nr:hypothetical protein [Rubellimicrobium sp. CFH 75288]NAZ38197.1 hypothetical protein [Rubellimicrobium sp. CFH 75288]
MPMFRPLALLALAALPGALAAQDLSEEQTRAYALIQPMLLELTPQAPVLAACVVRTAQPAELAQLAAAPGPSQAVGQTITAVLARPETLGCVQATLSR